MFGNKDLNESIENLKKLASKLDERIEKSNTENKAVIEKLQKQLEKITTENLVFDEKLKGELEDLKKIKKNFESEINSFAFLKENIKKNLIDNFKEDIKKEVKTINEETVNYFELKKQINDSNNLIKEFNGNINKLNEISKGIKEADFDLTKHYQNINKTDTEKLRLEKEVDRLQGIIANWKRRG